MRYPCVSTLRKFGSYSGEVGSEATTKKGLPVVSDLLVCHTTVTWLSPGIRKNGGASGANGSRNLLSNTAWATSALSSSERGTVFTSFCSMMPSRLLSFWLTHPMAFSIGRTSAPFAAISAPDAGMPGLKSPPTNADTMGVGAAWRYPTTIVFASPGLRVNGPDDWKNRVSAKFCAWKQKCFANCWPWKVQGKSPAAGLEVPDR